MMSWMRQVRLIVMRFGVADGDVKLDEDCEVYQADE